MSPACREPHSSDAVIVKDAAILQYCRLLFAISYAYRCRYAVTPAAHGVAYARHATHAAASARYSRAYYAAAFYAILSLYKMKRGGRWGRAGGVVVGV